MLYSLLEQDFLLYGMIGAGILGLFCIVMVNRFYSGAIRDLHHLEEPKGKWTKQFMEECQLRKTNEQEIHNPEAFIRRQLMEGSVWGVTIPKWKQGIGYGAIGCFLLMMAAVYGTYQYQEADLMRYQYVLTGAGIFAMLLLVKQFMGFLTKEDMILDGLMDYIENTSASEEDGIDMEQIREETREELIHQVREGISQSAAGGTKFSQLLTPEEEDLMRDVIREYLT